jgi:hypothetical protein
MVFPIIKALERQIFLRVFSQLFSNIYTNLWISFINLHFCHKHLVASSIFYYSHPHYYFSG